MRERGGPARGGAWLLLVATLVGCQDGMLQGPGPADDATSSVDAPTDLAGGDLISVDGPALRDGPQPDGAADAGRDLAAGADGDVDQALHDAAPADLAWADAALADAAVPDAGLADLAVRDVALPDAALPDGALADGAAPDGGVSASDATPNDAQPDAVADAGPEYCNGNVTCDCQAYSARRGGFVNLWGRVRQVDYNADFALRVVTALENLRVQQVTALPTSCGKWQVVTYNEDFTYQVVTYNEDFKIRYVTSLPGVP